MGLKRSSLASRLSLTLPQDRQTPPFRQSYPVAFTPRTTPVLVLSSLSHGRVVAYSRVPAARGGRGDDVWDDGAARKARDPQGPPGALDVLPGPGVHNPSRLRVGLRQGILYLTGALLPFGPSCPGSPDCSRCGFLDPRPELTRTTPP